MIWNSSDKALIVIDETICEEFNGTVDNSNVLIGSTYLTLSLIFQIAYLPCFITFLHRDCRCYSCFKLMIVIGIVDMITTNNDLTITGLFSLIGLSYCTTPTFSKISNFISLTCWFAHCSLCIILNLNRCCNLYFGRTVESFTKSKLWLWIFLAFSYAFIMCLICPQGFYHSNLGIWISESDPKKRSIRSLAHLFNNICAVVIITAQYAFMAVILHQRSNKVSDKRLNTRKPELSVLIQSVIICLLLITCSTLYIIIDFIHLPSVLLPFIHISWMFSQGGKAFLYIALNSKIRRKIGDIFVRKKIDL